MTTDKESTSHKSPPVWRLPPFWTEDPSVWFEVAESHFDLWNITNSSTKLAFVVVALPKQIAIKARDLILHPHPVKPYEQFKLALIKQLTESGEIRLEGPIGSQVLRNRKPSEMFRCLKHTLRDISDESVLHSLFMNCLSPHMRNILKPVKSLPVDKLASLADDIQVAMGTGNSTDQVTHELCSQMETLNDKLRLLLRLNFPDTPSRSPPLEPVPVSHPGYDHVHLGIIGPLPQSDGFSHILTCVDHITGWPEAAAMKNAKAKTVESTFVQCWISRFGSPSTVTTPKESQFKSKSFYTTFHKLGINHCISTAFDQSARKMKEFHDKIKKAIRALGCASKWPEALPSVLTQIRATGQTDVVHSPSEKVYQMDFLLDDEFEDA